MGEIDYYTPYTSIYILPHTTTYYYILLTVLHILLDIKCHLGCAYLSLK